VDIDELMAGEPGSDFAITKRDPAARASER
jgi:hypothetical protein